MLGHQKQYGALKNDLKVGSLAHTYLFSGPKGIGKFTLAKEFAREILGLAKENLLESNIDISIVCDNGDSLKIEEIKKVCASAVLSIQEKYKIILIKNIERLTNEAANAFLKTLEEPNQRVIFILTTSDFQKVLDTIKSRARILNFQILSNEEMKNFAQDFNLEEKLLKKYLFWSAGRPGKFFKFAHDEEYASLYFEMEEKLKKFFENKNLSSLWMYLEELSKEKADVLEFLELWEILAKEKNPKFGHFLYEAKIRVQGNVNTRLL
ncbi:hypothetical protein A2335_04555, partial [Candidatus Peregrinibacteria bacterium RIFOXYB2_FULL_32_7]